MTKGSHPIHRSILDHWIWLKEKPFTSGQAWVDLILLANHSDKKAIIEGDIKIIKRGQVYRSQLTLSKRWGWSRKRTFNFLKLLEKDEMLTHQGVQHGTIITLCNYSRLHETAFDRVTPKVTPRVAPTEHQQPTKGSTYNNDNNVKNDNNKTIEAFWEYFLSLTGKNYTLTPPRKNLIKSRLKDYSLEQLKSAVDRFVEDDWEGRSKYMDLVYCIGTQKGKGDALEKWLNTEPKQKKIISRTDL